MINWGPKKVKELELEIEELKNLLDGFSSKEERLKRFDELIKKARIEYADITKRKDQTAHTLEKLENERTRLNKEIQKISYEIRQLQEMKLNEENQIFTLNNALHVSSKILNNYTPDTNQLSNRKLILNQEIDAAEKRRDEIKNETFVLEKRLREINQKTKEVKSVQLSLLTEIERRKEEIKNLIERKKVISEQQPADLNREPSESSQEAEKISGLISDEAKIKESLNVLNAEANVKKEEIAELDKKISEQKSQLESLVVDYKAGTELLSAVTNKHEKLTEEMEYNQATLNELHETIDIATTRLTDLNHSLNILDEEFSTLSKEISDKKSSRLAIEKELKEKNSELQNLEDDLKELRETVTILAKLKNDIEQGSGLSAKRFTGVLKYYSSFINKMYKQKIQLEKVIDKKEKDIEEKDKLLEEKQSALNEIERAIFIDHDTAELFKETIERIHEQWDKIRNLVSFSNDKGFEKILETEEENPEKENAKNKLFEFENTLKEMKENSGKYLERLDYKSTFFENDRIEYDNRLGELNNRIKNSVNELSTLHDSINKIKEEHEEHRQDINKLVSIKEKLAKEISNYEATIEKYKKIMDEINRERNQIKERRLSKEIKVESNKEDVDNKTQDQEKTSLLKT